MDHWHDAPVSGGSQSQLLAVSKARQHTNTNSTSQQRYPSGRGLVAIERDMTIAGRQGIVYDDAVKNAV
jgi:hypothetical protein